MPSLHRPALTPAQAWTAALAGTGSFMVVLDLFAVSTALREIRTSLHASVGALAWTVNAYTLSFATLLITAAALGDRWGRRRLYSGGLALFAVSSAACARAPDIAVLLAARVAQGAGAALIMPLALALLNAAFPPQRRGWAMGVYGSITGVGTVLGPVLGGALTQGLSWPWIFWINVPIGLLAAGAVLRFCADSRGTRRPLDPLALGLAIVCATGIVWGIIRAATAGWADHEVLGALAVGLAALGGLLAWLRRAENPMIPLRLFGNGTFSAGNAAMFAQSAALTAMVFFTAQFLQDGQGDDPLAAGLRLLPLGVVPLLVATRSGALADRAGPRPLVLGGLILQAIGLAALAWLGTPHRPYLALAGPMLLVGTGVTLALPALTKAVVGSVEPGDIGSASGLFSTLRQLGGAFGVAVTSAVFTATGGYGGPARVAAGYQGAMYLAAVLSGLGAGAALRLRRPQARPPGQAGPETTTAVRVARAAGVG
jgi:EmrB/QacA subfamily drug resistance transporter